MQKNSLSGFPASPPHLGSGVTCGAGCTDPLAASSYGPTVTLIKIWHYLCSLDNSSRLIDLQYASGVQV